MFFLCVYLNICMSVHHVCALPVEARGRHQVPVIGVIDSCEPQCGCWKHNLGLLEEQPVFSTFESPLALILTFEQSFLVISKITSCWGAGVPEV